MAEELGERREVEEVRAARGCRPRCPHRSRTSHGGAVGAVHARSPAPGFRIVAVDARGRQLTMGRDLSLALPAFVVPVDRYFEYRQTGIIFPTFPFCFNY